MEVALEFEDDSFFADLSKQISLLIMDDDEIPISNWNSPSPQPQGFSETVPNQPIQASVLYEQSCGREMSKGTGVFIPKLSQPRRTKGNRQGRYSSFNSRSYNKQISDTTRSGSLSQNNNNNNYSFNPKKHYYVPN